MNAWTSLYTPLSDFNMLSRSSSNAGDRLRRAKSTSSAHTSSSGLRSIPVSNDPFVVRQQAEAAAVEAFNRARSHRDSTYLDYRPVPPKPERRRSRVSGRAEGSHFEDARLGRRRSNSKKSDSRAGNSSRVQPLRRSDLASESNGEESMVTRKRSVIPPNPNTSLGNDAYALPSTSRNVRMPQAGHADGSPVPRRSAAVKGRSSTLQLQTPRLDRTSGYSSNGYHAPDIRYSEEVPVQAAETPKGSIQERQTDEEILAIARDRCLQGFQNKKLRERKSFILAPFQKRRATNIQKSSESSYDTSLPPFNYADESLLPPPPPLPSELEIPTITVHADRKTRNFSESLKGRFKKVFRKASRAPSGMPAQHVEGKRFHYSTNSPLSTPTISHVQDEDPFTVAGDPCHLTGPDIKLDSASGRQSVAERSVAKSRVTSWTNSTVPGTWSTRPDEEYQGSADENGRLKRSDSVSTLRKAASFFGRPVKNKLRRPSKAELQSSEDSAGLYSALQERINPADTVIQNVSQDETLRSQTSSALATLPSRQQANSTVSSQSRWAAPTIRSVTPDPFAYKLDIPSPVTEVLSPDPIEQPAGEYSQKDDQYEPTPRSHLQRRPALKAPTPSQELLARRMERSKNRWQSPLDELSPPAPTSTRVAMIEDNPYELRSLSSTLNQPPAGTDLPHHARVGEQRSAVRQDILSPSVYSRRTDGASPRCDTPVELGGTVVTITGHEVRSYSISPQKREQHVVRPVQGSREWRRWLSDEMNGWNNASTPEDFSLPKAIFTDATSARTGLDIAKQNSEQETPELRSRSVSPTLVAPPPDPRPQRPRRSSNRSSFMNERYPIIDTSRDLSDKSMKSGRRFSSRAESGTNSSEQTPKASVTGEDHTSADDVRPRSTTSRQRVVSKHQSIAHLESAARRQSTLSYTETSQDAVDIDNIAAKLVKSAEESSAQAEAKSKTSSRAKSAFNLRANYKSSSTGGAKPIAVRRKTENIENIHILEDSTIQNISAGPYASQPTVTTSTSSANKENTPPSEANGLLALSSSEWLGAGTSKRKTSVVHPAYRSRSTSRYSPSRTGNTCAGPGGSSPGQRLVTNWLDGKRSKENSPVFV